MSNSAKSWWAEAILSIWAGNQQSIPKLLTDLSTHMQDCPYSTPDMREIIEDCVAGYIRHGAYAAWAALASGRRPWAPLAVIPTDVRLLRRAAYSAAQRIQIGMIERGELDPAIVEVWSAVFGKLPPLQRLFTIQPPPAV